MDPIEDFRREVAKSILESREDAVFQRLSQAWMEKSVVHKYPYRFTWMGVPIIQYPQDIVAMQELVCLVKPDLIIETGIAHGGSLVFYASMLELLGGRGHVIGVDIDIRAHNRERLEQHPMFRRVSLVQGSSIAQETVKTVIDMASGFCNPLVVLDSMHTHSHVLDELRAYSHLIRKDSYIVVFDTLIEDMPESFYSDRPWSVGNNPKTAIDTFIDENDSFIVDNDIALKLMLTTCSCGFLRRVK